MIVVGAAVFQSPIGWGLSCESLVSVLVGFLLAVSIPYWLGSKLRGVNVGANRF